MFWFQAGQRFDPTIARGLFVCECGNPSHQFIFEVDDYNVGEPAEKQHAANVECSARAHMPMDHPWWRRVLIAVGYILGKRCRYGEWGSMTVSPDDARRLIALLELYRETCRKYDLAS